jgi:hypothetical protein
MAFEFDETVDPTANIAAFLKEMQAEDPEMAAILAANMEKLLTVHDGEKANRKALTAFNQAVVTALDDLLSKDEGQ